MLDLMMFEIIVLLEIAWWKGDKEEKMNYGMDQSMKALLEFRLPSLET